MEGVWLSREAFGIQHLKAMKRDGQSPVKAQAVSRAGTCVLVLRVFLLNQQLLP